MQPEVSADRNGTRIHPAFITVPVILGLGWLMGQISDSGYGNVWFEALRKPAAMPPGWAFGVAWALLYVLIGVASGLIIATPGSRLRTTALTPFGIQLLLNLSWSPIFFAMHAVKLALGVIVLMFLIAAASALGFGRIRRVAGLLMLPYLAWLLFATYLNLEIMRLNPAA